MNKQRGTIATVSLILAFFALSIAGVLRLQLSIFALFSGGFGLLCLIGAAISKWPPPQKA